ncbi:reverse transcriptase domain-containing protein [Tanacetum coccineum]
MIRSWPDDKKRKSIKRDESWMKVPILFPPLSEKDVSDEPLVIEAVMEGYLVRRVYIDQGASRRRYFAGEYAPHPIMSLFRRTGFKSTLRAVTSTIHSMITNPTPRGSDLGGGKSWVKQEKFCPRKDITKENKNEYRWTESAEKAFQEMKQCIMGLPLLTTLVKEEMLYVYLAAATEAVSVVLLTERNGKQCPIHYVSRTLNEADRNYAPMEKLALSIRKLAKYSVELGAYNIAYEPRSAIKGQVLADFLSEAPVGTHPKEFFRLSADVPNQDEVEKWTIFTDVASNNKGSEAGLVLISLSGIEFTYAL